MKRIKYFRFLRKRHTLSAFRRSLRILFSFYFVFSSIPGFAYVASHGINIPPGSGVPIVSHSTSATLRGVKFYPEHPFRFDFIIEQGDSGPSEGDLQKDTTKFIKYFLASLTIAEEDLWVNLSPHEADRIIPSALGQTDMGRDLLIQDYLLKQLTASLMDPKDESGAQFWEKIHKKTYELYGTRDLPLNIFNKVWIVPETATVYENKDVAFVVESRLKVMMEKDYVASKATIGHPDAQGPSIPEFNPGKLGAGELGTFSRVSSEIIREILLPAIEHEVNEGPHFAQLRQIYHALILATWYKQTLKENLIDHVYVNQNKIKGIEIDNPHMKKQIYEQYLEAYRNGTYQYIREDYDPHRQQVIPRKYFSGGAALATVPNHLSRVTRLGLVWDSLSDSSMLSRASVELQGVPFDELPVSIEPHPSPEAQGGAADSALLNDSLNSENIGRLSRPFEDGTAHYARALVYYNPREPARATVRFLNVNDSYKDVIEELSRKSYSEIKNSPELAFYFGYQLKIDPKTRNIIGIKMDSPSTTDQIEKETLFTDIQILMANGYLLSGIEVSMDLELPQNLRNSEDPLASLIAIPMDLNIEGYSQAGGFEISVGELKKLDKPFFALNKNAVRRVEEKRSSDYFQDSTRVAAFRQIVAAEFLGYDFSDEEGMQKKIDKVGAKLLLDFIKQPINGEIIVIEDDARLLEALFEAVVNGQSDLGRELEGLTLLQGQIDEIFERFKDVGVDISSGVLGDRFVGEWVIQEKLAGLVNEFARLAIFVAEISAKKELEKGVEDGDVEDGTAKDEVESTFSLEDLLDEDGGYAGAYEPPASPGKGIQRFLENYISEHAPEEISWGMVLDVAAEFKLLPELVGRDKYEELGELAGTLLKQAEKGSYPLSQLNRSLADYIRILQAIVKQERMSFDEFPQNQRVFFRGFFFFNRWLEQRKEFVQKVDALVQSDRWEELVAQLQRLRNVILEDQLFNNQKYGQVVTIVETLYHLAGPQGDGFDVVADNHRDNRHSFTLELLDSFIEDIGKGRQDDYSSTRVRIIFDSWGWDILAILSLRVWDADEPERNFRVLQGFVETLPDERQGGSGFLVLTHYASLWLLASSRGAYEGGDAVEHLMKKITSLGKEELSFLSEKPLPAHFFVRGILRSAFFYPYTPNEGEGGLQSLKFSNYESYIISPKEESPPVEVFDQVLSSSATGIFLSESSQEQHGIALQLNEQSVGHLVSFNGIGIGEVGAVVAYGSNYPSHVVFFDPQEYTQGHQGIVEMLRDKLPHAEDLEHRDYFGYYLHLKQESDRERPVPVVTQIWLDPQLLEGAIQERQYSVDTAYEVNGLLVGAINLALDLEGLPSERRDLPGALKIRVHNTLLAPDEPMGHLNVRGGGEFKRSLSEDSAMVTDPVSAFDQTTGGIDFQADWNLQTIGDGSESADFDTAKMKEVSKNVAGLRIAHLEISDFSLERLPFFLEPNPDQITLKNGSR